MTTYSIGLLIVATILVLNVHDQKGDLARYKKAYDYLKGVIRDSSDIGNLQDDCDKLAVGRKKRIKPGLQIADRYIENKKGFPLCDLLKKKYKIEVSCAVAIGSGQFELTHHVKDSLSQFWEGYKMKTKTEISETLQGLTSRKKDGYQVFFSDIYKNTLAAEVKEFCLSYDTQSWQGTSNIFFFVFNDKGDIEEIYIGATIYYG